MALPGNETGPIVPVTWLIDHLGDPGLKIIDVRPHEQYLAGHIPGAISVDILPARLLASSEDAISRWRATLEQVLRRAGIQQSDSIIAYEDFSGTSAAYAVWLGDAAGLAGSAMLDGGFNAWQASGQPVERQPNSPAPSDLSLRLNEDVIATAAGIADALGNGSEAIQLVDTRADQEYLMGTIPGAAHFDWMWQLNPDGTFRPMDDLRREYEQRGVDLDADAPTASFCGSGLRAANGYVVLKQLGARHPRDYGPSWTEWSRQPNLPKQRPDPADV